MELTRSQKGKKRWKDYVYIDTKVIDSARSRKGVFILPGNQHTGTYKVREVVEGSPPKHKGKYLS
jgi:hypothetical protein